jgi:hypothetical protein
VLTFQWQEQVQALLVQEPELLHVLRSAQVYLREKVHLLLAG